LERLLAQYGEPAWRADQIRVAAWDPRVGGFAAVKQLPALLRTELDDALTFSTVEVADIGVANGGLTLKLLCRLSDGLTVEAVAMESPASDGSRRRATVCVSSQVGCAIGCPFCATGHMGL